jgi:hypothetical protein
MMMFVLASRSNYLDLVRSGNYLYFVSIYCTTVVIQSKEEDKYCTIQLHLLKTVLDFKIKY